MVPPQHHGSLDVIHITHSLHWCLNVLTGRKWLFCQYIAHHWKRCELVLSSRSVLFPFFYTWRMMSNFVMNVSRCRPDWIFAQHARPKRCAPLSRVYYWRSRHRTCQGLRKKFISCSHFWLVWILLHLERKLAFSFLRLLCSYGCRRIYAQTSRPSRPSILNDQFSAYMTSNGTNLLLITCAANELVIRLQ